MKYYKSKGGKILSEAQWKEELEVIWSKMPTEMTASYRNHNHWIVKRPEDSWERFKKMLTEVDYEEYTDSVSGYNGVF